MVQRKEVLEILMSLEDIGELKLIRSAINDRIRELGHRIKYQLNKGDSVIINSRKGTEDGIIEKVNRTRAVVIINGTHWNVPFNMITKT